jgi:hypothetical protein
MGLQTIAEFGGTGSARNTLRNFGDGIFADFFIAISQPLEQLEGLSAVRLSG